MGQWQEVRCAVGLVLEPVGDGEGLGRSARERQVVVMASRTRALVVLGMMARGRRSVRWLCVRWMVERVVSVSCSLVWERSMGSGWAATRPEW